MVDSNEFLWDALELTDPTYPDVKVRYWPAAFREALTALNLLRPAEAARYVICPSCHRGHLERVIALPGHDGQVRFFIPCPDALRVELSPSDRAQWAIDVDAMASNLAAALGLAGRCKCLVPSRLWRLGRTAWQGQSRDVLFARGLTWKDGRRMARHIARTTRPVVFVSSRLPSRRIWPGRIPPLVVLSQVATLGDHQLELDRDAVFTVIREADENAETNQTVELAMDQFRESILQDLRAEQSADPIDDIYVAAYLAEGSYRKAAQRLSEELGRPITKDRVERAVQRRAAGKSPRRRRTARATNRGLSHTCDSVENSSNSLKPKQPK